MTTADRSGPASKRIENDAVYEELRRRIIDLDLRPGARLREQTLADEFGISRTPIRRILDRLANDGLVSMSPGSGASVSIVDFGALREVWALRMKVSELLGDVIVLPAKGDVVERIADLAARLDQLEPTADGRQVVGLFDEYHVLLLGLMTDGPLRHIYDQLYAQSARMFASLVPNLDLAVEIEFIRDEVQEFLAAVQEGSSVRIGEIRFRYLESVLTRINEAPILSPMGR